MTDKILIKKALIFAGITLILTACNGVDNYSAQTSGLVQENIQPVSDLACTTALTPGIVVEITDNDTNEPIAEKAIVTITDGSYEETLNVSGYGGTSRLTALSVAGAFERAGIYDIELTLNGYENWSRYDVEVIADECHVKTVTLWAQLDSVE